MNRRQLLHTMAAGPLAAVVANHTRAEAAVQSAGAAERLVVISLDGVRTQEMFGGLDGDTPASQGTTADNSKTIPIEPGRNVDVEFRGYPADAFDGVAWVST